jgi:DNA invertase Pin-like site-specific DNA recombinase
MIVARYHRVSTSNQNLSRQTDATAEYVSRTWPDAETRTYADASTGTDTDRSEYERLMAAVSAGDVDVVVVHEVSRISRSVRDLSRIVDKLRQHDTGLHIISEGIEIPGDGDTDPYQQALLQLLGVFAELEATMTQKRVREGISARQQSDDYQHGPAPLGYDKDGGQLREGPQYDRVCTVLAMVDDGEMSQRQASKELDCGRKTIRTTLRDRRELYDL